MATFRVGDKEVPFPFDQPRPGQIEAVREVCEALQTEDIAVVCAPTGFGKSAFVVAAANVLNGAYVLTPQTVLIGQYEADFKALPYVGFLKSSKNFECLQPDTLRGVRTCRDHGSECPERKRPPHDENWCSECPYIVARDEALSRRTVVMTAAMGATLAKYTPFLTGRPALILDESQRIEDTVMDMFSTDLDHKYLQDDGWDFESGSCLLSEGSAFKRPVSYEPVVFPAVDAAESVLRNYLRCWTELVFWRYEMMERYARYYETDEIDKAEMYNERAVKIQRVLDYLDAPPDVPSNKNPEFLIWRKDEKKKGRSKTYTKRTLSCKAATAVGLLPLLFGELSEKLILVSATPGSADLIAASLGLPPINVYREYGTPFPVDNRRVLYKPIARLNKDAPPEDWERVIDEVVRLATTDERAQQKGIIHTVSSEFHSEIVEAFKSRGLKSRLVEVTGSVDRQKNINCFMASSEPLIMIGPGLTDGLDLKGDLCRWGIIAKVPWPDLGDKTVQIRNKRFPGWYAYKAILGIIQACGRNVRSADDWAVNYILDESFGGLMQRNKRLFPDWFLEAVETVLPQRRAPNADGPAFSIGKTK